MTYVGQVKNGVVVLKNAPSLEEGTTVRVEIVEPPRQRPAPGTKEAILGCKARWAGDPVELDRILEEIQREREADLMPMDDEE